MLLHQGLMEYLLTTKAKEGIQRKYNGNIITGTQSINDYYKTPATKAIIENSDWTCLLSQKAESIEAFKNSGRILMDDEMERVLKSLRTADKQYSEVMICGNGGYTVGRLIVDPYSIALYSSKAEDFNKIQELNKKGLTVAQALDVIIRNNEQEERHKESIAFLVRSLQRIQVEANTNFYMKNIKKEVDEGIQGIMGYLETKENNHNTL